MQLDNKCHHNQPEGRYLVQVWHILVQVIETHNQGEGRHKDKEHVGDAPHPRAVPKAILRGVDCPYRQATLIQFQQPLIALHEYARFVRCASAGTVQR